MPRIRTIKPDFWSSEKVAARLPGQDGRHARLLFVALLNLAEDTGVARAHPAHVRAFAFPYDEDVTNTDVERWLRMLEDAGFLWRYRVADSSYLFLRGFAEHQRIDKPSKGTLPLPPGEPSAAPPGALPEPSPSTPGGLPVGREGKGREWKGTEGAPPGAALAAGPLEPFPVAVTWEELDAVHVKVRGVPLKRTLQEEQEVRPLLALPRAQVLADFEVALRHPTHPTTTCLRDFNSARVQNMLPAMRAAAAGTGPIPGRKPSRLADTSQDFGAPGVRRGKGDGNG